MDMKSNDLTMESLQLPKELYWDGKSEPISPPSSELFSVAESINGNWLEEDNFANEITLITTNCVDDENGLDIKFLENSEELINGDDYVIELSCLKDETWCDSKLLTTSPFSDYSTIGSIIPFNPVTKVQLPSPFDVNTFDGTTNNNNNNLGNAVFTQLTPPQSPPQNGINSGVSPVAFQSIATTSPNHPIENQSSVNVATQVHQQQQQQQQQQQPREQTINATTVQNLQFTWNTNNAANIANAIAVVADHETITTAAPLTSYTNGNGTAPAATTATTATTTTDFINDIDMVHDAQIVDEIVNTRAKELLEWMNDDCESVSSSYSAPSNAGSFTDEEWLPGSGSSSSYAASMSSAASSPMREEQSVAAAIINGISTPPKKRTRPYGRGIEDRKMRKKEQNKNAATRYRQKKKIEMETVLTEEQILSQRNDELKRILAERKREVKYLKTLLKEFCRKKQ